MILDELRLEWRGWWRGLDATKRWSPFALVIVFLGLHAFFRGLRSDHFWLVAAGLGLYFSGPRLRLVWRWVQPLVLMTVIYDFQRYWAGTLRGTVRVAELRSWELAWFGIATEGGLITPAQWWQAHTLSWLDAVTGAGYLSFFPVFLGCAAWWRFREQRPDALQLMWAMLWLNLAGYLTYLVFPAAPPWYVDHYGLGQALLAAAPEAGGAARFDALFGVQVFAGIYGRNANVFGAVPSLHVGQTFLAVLFAWRFGSLRVLATGFWLLVTFGSVYLNHHYLVDGVVGMVFATIAMWITILGVRHRQRSSRKEPDSR